MATAVGAGTAAALWSAASVFYLLLLPDASNEFWSFPRLTLGLLSTFLTSFASTFIAASLAASSSGASRTPAIALTDESPSPQRPVV